MVQEKETLNKKQSLTCRRWCHVYCSFYIYFCASSSSCCCIIVVNSPSLVIICSLFSRFCTSTSSSSCRAKASWESLEIAALSSGRLDMKIAAYHSWGELIYHLFGADLLWYIFDRHFQKFVLEDCVVIGGRSTPFDILGCAIGLVDGTQCKCKHKRWFVFYTFMWTSRETDYLGLSCELVGWLALCSLSV